MNIKMPKLPAFVKNAAVKVSGKVIKYRPEIKLGLGIVCILGGTVLACMASRKVDDVLEEADMRLAEIRSEDETNQLVTEGDTRKALAKEYARICWTMAKLYGPSILLLTGGIASICSSHVELKNRSTAITAAYTALGNAYNAYRQKIIEVLGEDEEEKIRLGVEKETRDVVVVDEDGNAVPTVEELYSQVADPNSPFAIYFDETTSKHAVRSIDANWTFIMNAQAAANLAFSNQGKGGFYPLLYVIDHLGMYQVLYRPEYKHFLTAGWVEGHGEDYIDFHAKKVTVTTHDNFGNPIREEKILLEFNCDKEPYYMNL